METLSKAMDASDPMDVHESQSPNVGGSRRPGNLWTDEARDDIFRRREAGEGWETICKDYPNRSKHALQQQNSMMKKAKALADGVPTTNRRGRKRKYNSWKKGKVGKNSSMWYGDDDGEEIDDEDYEDPELDDDSDYGDKIEINAHNPIYDDGTIDQRPPLPQRSATEPMARPLKSKIVTFPNPPNSAGALRLIHMTEKSSTGGEWVSGDKDILMHPNKRQKYSPEAIEKPDHSTLSTSATTFGLPALMCDEALFSEFISKLREKARDVASSLEADKAAHRQTFEASNRRAHRRTYEVQERLRNAHQDHADTLKSLERQHSDSLKVKERQQADALVAMRHDIELAAADEGNRLKERIRQLETDMSEAQVVVQEKYHVHVQDLAAKDESLIRALKQKDEEDLQVLKEKDESHAQALRTQHESHVRALEELKENHRQNLRENDTGHAAAPHQQDTGHARVMPALEDERPGSRPRMEAPAPAPTPASAPEPSPAVPSSGPDPAILNQLTDQERQLRLYDALRLGMSIEVQKVQILHSRSQESVGRMKTAVQELSTSIAALSDGIEDMSVKAIGKAIGGIQETNQTVRVRADEAVASLETINGAVAGLVAALGDEGRGTVVVPEQRNGVGGGGHGMLGEGGVNGVLRRY